jgi:hypothetical protein
MANRVWSKCRIHFDSLLRNTAQTTRCSLLVSIKFSKFQNRSYHHPYRLQHCPNSRLRQLYPFAPPHVASLLAFGVATGLEGVLSSKHSPNSLRHPRDKAQCSLVEPLSMHFSLVNETWISCHTTIPICCSTSQKCCFYSCTGVCHHMCRPCFHQLHCS